MNNATLLVIKNQIRFTARRAPALKARLDVAAASIELLTGAQGAYMTAEYRAKNLARVVGVMPDLLKDTPFAAVKAY